MNCGFVSWIDDQEWPETLKNALNRLWQMYYEANNARINERVENCEVVKQLTDEKIKFENDYVSLLNDVKKFWQDTEKRVMSDNYKKIISGEVDKVKDVENERDLYKIEVDKLKSELNELKQLHRTQAEVMKGKQLTWQGEKEALKDEKKKVEYMLHDLFLASGVLKEKVKKIRAICDE
jgi:hypothetical protein